MTIRNATLQDIPCLASLFDQYRVFYHQASDQAGAQTFLADRIKAEQSVIFVAILDNEMVGFAQLYPVFSSVGMKKAWIVNDLFVVEFARGSGAADALLSAAEQMGADTGSAWLLLQTGVYNHRAQRVYERNGWKKDADFFSYYYSY